MHGALRTIGGVGFALLVAACGKSAHRDGSNGGSASTDGGSAGADGGTGGAGTEATGGTAGNRTDGTSGGANAAGSGAASSETSGTGGSSGTTGVGGMTVSAGSGGVSGAGAAGMTGSAGMAGGAGMSVVLPALVTSAPGAYWKTDGTLTESTATALVTVDDTTTIQDWDGFGGAFNELGWSYLTSDEMVSEAVRLLFSAEDGANFAWGRIPIGASDYATSRYTLDDSGDDPTPNQDETNRPAADATLMQFSLERDEQILIPAIKAAQMVKPELRFWASPWTPPVWMKTGYRKTSNVNSTSNATKPSFYDGGSMRNEPSVLAAYAAYFAAFVEGYRKLGIDIRVVAPQEEPSYEQNYPSCLWNAQTYAAFVREHLGPAMKELGVDVMLGTLAKSESGGDLELAKAVLADSTAASFLSVIGAQWGALDGGELSNLDSKLPVWATEHKGGNYPWLGNYVSSGAPNDHAYAVESWVEIRDAITKAKVTTYNAWNMVLDPYGWSIDTSVEWAQDALLVASEGTVTPTPAYYVFRHLSQYVMPGAKVVGTSGGDAVAFKNPDGSLVAVMFNSGVANANYTVALGGRKFSFLMPENGWATIKVEPVTG